MKKINLSLTCLLISSILSSNVASANTTRVMRCDKILGLITVKCKYVTIPVNIQPSTPKKQSNQRLILRRNTSQCRGLRNDSILSDLCS